MIIEIGNVYSKIVKSTAEEYKIFRQTLTFKVPNCQFSEKYKRGIWDGTKKFYRGKSFPTGLLCLLEATDLDLIVRKRQRNYSFDIYPDMLATKKMMGKYSFQIEVAQLCVANRRGILHLATNAGKTVIAAAIAKAVDEPVLFMNHTQELMYQTANVFEEELQQPIGLLGDEKEKYEKITVGMPITIGNRFKNKKMKEYLSSVRCVFADECHHASSYTWREVLKKLKNAEFRFGLSGTPLDRSLIENLTLVAYTGDEIARVSNDDLIRYGVSSKPKIFVYTTNPQVEGKIWQDDYESGIVENTERNRRICKIVKKHSKETVLILVKRIRHGEMLKRLLVESDVDAEFCSGEDKTEKRQKELTAIKEGSRRVLVLSTIGEQGLDIPSIDVMIRASGGKSTISTIQTIGRGLRIGKDGKDSLVFYDFLDLDGGFLEEHSRQRIRDYEKENFELHYIGLV